MFILLGIVNNFHPTSIDDCALNIIFASESYQTLLIHMV